jgi:hypothetical protein
MGSDDILSASSLTGARRRPDDHGAARVGLLNIEEDFPAASAGGRKVCREFRSVVDPARRISRFGLGCGPREVITTAFGTHVGVLPCEGRASELEPRAHGNC